MFSPVEKATFRFWNGAAWDDPKKVMLNPADLSFHTSKYMNYKVKLARGKSEDERDSHVPTNYYSSLSMLLHFDLVHEYETFISGATEAVTSLVGFGVESLLGATGFHLYEADTFYVDKKLTMPWDVSLFNDKLSIYKKLEAVAKAVSIEDYTADVEVDKQKVKFEWGDIKYVGFVNDFSSKVDYFSAWGSPLRAEVNLTLTQAKDPDTKGFLNNLSASAEFTEKISTVVSGLLTNLRPTV